MSTSLLCLPTVDEDYLQEGEHSDYLFSSNC